MPVLQSLMLKNLLWSLNPSVVPKVSIKDLQKVFAKLREEKISFEAEGFMEAAPTLIIQQIVKAAGLYHQAKPFDELKAILDLLKDVILMQKYYQVKDKSQTERSESAADVSTNLDPEWLDLKASFSPEMIGCLNKEYLMHNALQVAKVIKGQEFGEWAMALVGNAYTDAEMADDKDKLLQVTQKVERYTLLLQKNQQIIDDYLRGRPGDQPDDAMKREKVETSEKISKYQKQVQKFSKKISDGCGFKGLVLRAILRCV